jgi:hypothetical protein
MIVINLGTGRCGTHSLTKLLSAQKNVKVTHEAFLLPWEYDRAALDNALANILKYDAEIKSDTGFYYLVYVETILELYPNTKFVCLRRNKEKTIRGYIGKVGKKRANHWTRKNSKHWTDGWINDSKWDRCYPKYDLDQREAIEKYYDEYYSIAETYQSKYKDNFRIWWMNFALNTEQGQKEIFNFINLKDHVVELGIKIKT